MIPRALIVPQIALLCACAAEQAAPDHNLASAAAPSPAASPAVRPNEAAPALSPASPSRSFASFRPSQHGFRFVNRFTGSPLPFEGWNQKLGVPDRFGLCGGMSCAAADLYLAGQRVPEVSTPPERGTPLYDFIYHRQVSTFGLGSMALRFVEWMEAPEEGPRGTYERTAAELPEVLAALERGEPVILGLVLVARTSSGPQPEAWRNHQVLAYAADRLPMGVVELRIYDPNFPDADDVMIRYMPRPDGTRISRVAPGKRLTAVRGFFRMPYAPVSPPELGT